MTRRLRAAFPVFLVLLVAALAAAGCLAPALPEGAPPESPAFRLSPAQALVGTGFAAEPSIAVRSAGDATMVVVANMAFSRGDGPLEDSRFTLEVHRSQDGGATWVHAPFPLGAVSGPFNPLGLLRYVGDPVLGPRLFSCDELL